MTAFLTPSERQRRAVLSGLREAPARLLVVLLLPGLSSPAAGREKLMLGVHPFLDLRQVLLCFASDPAGERALRSIHRDATGLVSVTDGDYNGLRTILDGAASGGRLP